MTELDGFAFQSKLFLMEVLENCQTGFHMLSVSGVAGNTSYRFQRDENGGITDLNSTHEESFSKALEDSLAVKPFTAVSMRSHLSIGIIEVRSWGFKNGRYKPVPIADLMDNLYQDIKETTGGTGNIILREEWSN